MRDWRRSTPHSQQGAALRFPSCRSRAWSVGAFLAAMLVPWIPVRTEEHPNVLLIMVDDLNDWSGPAGGNLQAQTPHLDRFAQDGAVVFRRAHCPAPQCGPSRSALLSGFMPQRTGVYNNHQNMRQADLVRRHATLPEYFARHGYETLSRGKIFHIHHGDRPHTRDEGQWAFERWENADSDGGVREAGWFSRAKALLDGKPDPAPPDLRTPPVDFTWGRSRANEADTMDRRTAEWAARELRHRGGNERPFFMAVGIFRPHLPWFVPARYFDRYPLESIELPKVPADDLLDIRSADGSIFDDGFWAARDDYAWVARDPDLYRRAVRAYLATVSYADDCVGTVLDALAGSVHAENTVVVVAGDHGWHLGEKQRFRKSTLWAESTRTTLLIRPPGHRMPATCERVVNLVDLFPTLVELCGLPAKAGLDGRSLVPLLKDSYLKWDYAGLTVNAPGDVAVYDERWYYIQRPDGANELYDMLSDPDQWRNLITGGTSEVVAARERLSAQVPGHFAEPLPVRAGKRSGPPDMSISATRDLKLLQ